MPKGVYQVHVDKIFSQANIQPNVRFEVQDCNTITSMVQEGLGITIGPELFLKHQINIKIGSLTISNWRSIALAYPMKEYVSPAVQAFLSVARDAFSEK
ncbi:DNA-binding transcriptional regulator IlvY [compost metagenome]